LILLNVVNVKLA